VAELTAVHEPSPFAVPSRKLGIWMFIVADAATFAARSGRRASSAAVFGAPPGLRAARSTMRTSGNSLAAI